MTDRRAHDPKAPNRDAVEPQDAPEPADEQTVEPAPGDAQGAQEPPQGVESGLEPTESPSTAPLPVEGDLELEVRIGEDEWTPAGDREVPQGTVEEVVEWAGDDHERIRAAVAAEQAGKQRKGVLALADRLED